MGAEAIAFDLAVELITKLSSFTLSQIGLCWNVKDDLHDLKSTVSTIKAVLLDAEERSVTSQLVKDWLEKLRDVLYDADDLLDDFSAEALRKDLLGGNKLTKEVSLFFSSSNQFAYGLKMGLKIKAIRARLASIESEAKVFNLVERDRPMETSFTTKKRDDDKAALLKLVLEFESEDNVYIIPIVGFGGLGKTALAQFVYNDEMVKNCFELMMWVCVSDVFDVKIIVENMIKSATGKAPDQNLEMDQLQKQLREKIGGKKYLLVLDDIWNDEWGNWVNLKELLVGGAKGSRIIVTTRSSKVAKITSKCQPHVLKGLSDDDAWSLFKEIAFEQRPTDSTDSGFVEIGKLILERCCGVPLVIRTIAGTLSFKETKNEWLSFKDNELAKISQNECEILLTLKLSYDHLPSRLKHCFVYCRLYPKDYVIRVQTLVQLWIAQGFVKQFNQSKSLEEIGFGYFKDLVVRSFFQEVVEYGIGDMRCKMHDLIHDLAESIAGAESSIVHSNKIASKDGEKCRHISINPSLIPLFKGKKLRTLLQFPNKRVPNLSDETWNFVIANCRCLRVLELYDFDFKMIPRSIHKLKHLRYLDLSCNENLKSLPKSIYKIQNLQMLKLDWCDRFEELPKKIEKLVNLTHLGCEGCNGLTHMPRGIGKLSSLETLRMFIVDKDGSHGGADLSELSGLNILRGELRITNLGFVKNAKEKFKATNLKEKQHLRSLVLEWNRRGDDNDANKSLEDLQPHPNLKELCIRGWRGDAKFPSWISLLTNLVSWWRTTKPIDDDSDEDDTTVMGTSTMAFPCLSTLTISNCPFTSMPLYPSLIDDLRLVGSSSRPLKQTMKMNITSSTPSSSTSSLPLSKLKSLTLDNIEGLDTHTLDECLQHLTSHKDLEIWNCKEVDLEGMQWEVLKNLSHLEIDNIPKLVSLPIGLQHLVQLKTLKIHNCNGLRSLFPAFQHLTFLEDFSVSNCKELELSAAGIQIFQNYTSLCSLSLENMPECRHLPEWLQHLPNLQKLYLRDLPNLTSLPDEMRCLTKLQKLHIFEVPQLEERCRKDIGADWHKIAHIPDFDISGCY
ncbi:hypothetical protein ES288_A11G377400v1 [Gossypium darwinii]|uniref:Disease resistance protein RGA3 n=1 Tax=Gossypium darwinii TaxID=34276 RepID=A0A5D2EUE8_GOSDA|nr:hypothetical protein ES288_A11G377400v1 [Gossypium darwinii]